MLHGEVGDWGRKGTHAAYFVFVSHEAVHMESNQNSKGCVGIVEGILEVQSLTVCYRKVGALTVTKLTMG